jgi:2-haloacid dehalogenase/putative hydrolase of the HAD superfamily
MLEKLGGMGIAQEQILHTAESLFPRSRAGEPRRAHLMLDLSAHDDTGFGATMKPSVTPTYQFRFTSMMEMAKAHQAELTQR